MPFRIHLNLILEHMGNPNYPKVQPQIIPRSDSERFGSKLRDQFKSPRDFPSLLPRKGPFQAHRQPPSISYPIHLDSFSNSNVDLSAARSADQRKAGSWPRNPSFGLHLDGKSLPKINHTYRTVKDIEHFACERDFYSFSKSYL